VSSTAPRPFRQQTYCQFKNTSIPSICIWQEKNTKDQWMQSEASTCRDNAADMSSSLIQSSVSSNAGTSTDNLNQDINNYFTSINNDNLMNNEKTKSRVLSWRSSKLPNKHKEINFPTCTHLSTKSPVVKIRKSAVGLLKLALQKTCTTTTLPIYVSSKTS